MGIFRITIRNTISQTESGATARESTHPAYGRTPAGRLGTRPLVK
jgi:hypothetical protein